MSKKFPRMAPPGALAALALTALAAGAASAQSNVNISGYLDVGVYRDTSKVWNVGPIQRSNLAFSGTEDLGDGFKALFRLSMRFDNATGALESATKPFWHDESTVGLSGRFGTVKLGRRLDAMYSQDWAFDPWYNFDRVASPAWDLWHYNYPSDPKGNNGSAEYGRLNNGLFYDSPTVSGFSVHLSGSPESSPGDANKPFTGTLKYKSDAFSALLSHGKNSAGNTDTFVGLKTTLAGVELMGAHDVSKAGSSTAKTTTLGTSYRTGLVTLRAGWGQVDVDGVKAEKVLAVGAVYDLSKRTSVYADLARKSFPTRSADTYGVGIAHSF